MKTTASNLIRWAGLSAVVGGCLFVGIQPIHPPEILSSFTTSTWAIVHYVGVAMCFLILLGITGIYARQVEESGWLGLASFSPVWPHVGAHGGVSIRRRPDRAAVGDRRTQVRGGLRGDQQWVPQRGQPRNPPSGVFADIGTVFARRRAVWHRDLPRRHPAALGRRRACRRDRCATRTFAPPAPRVHPAGGGSSGNSSGLAGLCALVRRARESLGTRISEVNPATPPSR